MRSVAAKMFLAFSVALVAFALAAAFAVARLRALGADLRLVSEGYLPLTRIAAGLEVKDWVTGPALEVRAMDPAARRALLPVARAHVPAVIRERLAEARAVLARSRPLAEGSDAAVLEEVTRRVETLDARWSAYDAASRRLLDRLERPSPGDERALADEVEGVRKLEKGLTLEAKLLQASLEGQVAARVREAERAERRSALLAVLASALAAAVGVAAMLFGGRLLAPIRSLTEGVKAVAAGDLRRTVAVHSGDELGTLAQEFNAMAASLDRQRAELLRAERLAAVGRISSQITHEIRNPLNAIGLNAELLAELTGEPGAADPVEARSLAQAIVREVDRLHTVTEEYLRFARLPKPAFAREDLNELLASLAEFVRPELEVARVALVLELAPGLPAVRADQAQLRAAFLNLIRNAREAMPDGGRLTLATRPAGAGVAGAAAGVAVDVKDTGVGIAPEALPRIFETFYSTKEKGTGLGLAFSQQVVQEHAGTLVCESAPGLGTTFTVRLPRAPVEREVGAAVEEEVLS